MKIEFELATALNSEKCMDSRAWTQNLIVFMRPCDLGQVD